MAESIISLWGVVLEFKESVLFPGFMMEMASWDGGISRTVQFLVPKVRAQCPDCALSFFISLFTQPRLNCPLSNRLTANLC